MYKLILFTLSLSFFTPAIALPNKYEPHLSKIEGGVTFNIQDLLKMRNDMKLTRIADLLAQLPGSMKKQAILIFKSRSLQEARFQAPRVLLFNENATLVISFNGDSSQFGFESLEVMSFNFKLNRFEFQELTFENDLKEREDFLDQAKLQRELRAIRNRSSR